MIQFNWIDEKNTFYIVRLRRKKNNLWSLSAENSKQDILNVYDPSY